MLVSNKKADPKLISVIENFVICIRRIWIIKESAMMIFKIVSLSQQGIEKSSDLLKITLGLHALSIITLVILDCERNRINQRFLSIQISIYLIWLSFYGQYLATILKGNKQNIDDGNPYLVPSILKKSIPLNLSTIQPSTSLNEFIILLLACIHLVISTRIKGLIVLITQIGIHTVILALYGCLNL